MGYETSNPAAIPAAARLALRQTVAPTGINLGPPGGVVQPSYTDISNLVIGYENMAAWWTACVSSSQLTVLLSGDSTFLDQNIGNAAIQWLNVIKNGCLSAGYTATVTRNAVSGKATPEWLATYLPQDLAGAAPTLYVLKWGMNDPNDDHLLTAEQTIANVRQGLASLRAAWSRNTTSVIVMMPNTARYGATAVNELYREQLAAGLAQAALDYDCVFFDTYALARSIRAMSTTSWLDAIAVHPGNTLQLMIAGKLLDVMFAPHVLAYWARRVEITQGSGMSNGVSGASKVCTSRRGNIVTMTGILGGVGSVPVARTLGTIATDGHRPTITEWGLVCTVIQSGVATVLPIKIDPAGVIVATGAVAIETAQYIAFNCVWVRGAA